MKRWTKNLVIGLLLITMSISLLGCGPQGGEDTQGSTEPLMNSTPSDPTKGTDAAPSDPTKGTDAAPSDPTKGTDAAPSDPTKGTDAAPSDPTKGTDAAPSDPTKGTDPAPSNPTTATNPAPSNPTTATNPQPTNPPETLPQPTDPPKPETELSYPLDTDVELSVWTIYSPFHDSYKSAEESPWHMGLADKTGVEVKWQYPVPGADPVQAFNLLLTESVLPDIMGSYVSPGEAQQLMDEGAIIDLKPYLAKYAPNYWAYLNEPGHEDRLRSVSTADGRIYYFGYFTEAEYNTCAYGPIVRKDWLDACNLDIPVTMADWEEMLIAFRDKFGAKFASPYSDFQGVGLASGTNAQASLSARYYVENGQVKFSHTQPEYKEYLRTLNRWVELRVFDEDTLTMNEQVFRTKMMNNKVGASYVPLSLFTKCMKDAEVVNNGAQWIPVPYPVPNEGDIAKCVNYIPNNYPGGCVISGDCSEEKIAIALSWLNYGFDKEGLIYYNYGEEGLHHIVDENGNYAWTPLITMDPEGATMSTQRYTAMGAASVSMPTIQLANTVKIKNHPVAGEGVYTWLSNQEGAKHYLPTLALGEDERAIYVDTHLAITTFVDEKIMRIITGEDSIDSFDDMVEDVYNMGLQEVLDIQNAAYQRYLKG